MKPNHFLRLAAIAIFGLSMLTACGQKGPLYLPKPEMPATQAKAATSQSSSAPASSAPAGNPPPAPVTQ